MTVQTETPKRQLLDSFTRLADIKSKLPEFTTAIDNAQPGFPGGGTGGSGEQWTRPERLGSKWAGGGIDEETGKPIQAYPDEALSDWAQWQRLAGSVHRQIQLMEQLTNKWTTTTHKKPEDDDDLWCVNHALLKVQEPRAAGKSGGRCDYCLGFKQEWGFEAPPDILEYRERHAKSVPMAMVERHVKLRKVHQAKKRKGPDAA